MDKFHDYIFFHGNVYIIHLIYFRHYMYSYFKTFSRNPHTSSNLIENGYILVSYKKMNTFYCSLIRFPWEIIQTVVFLLQYGIDLRTEHEVIFRT